MEISILLAKILGCYLVGTSLAALSQRKRMVSVVDSFFKNQPLVLFSGGMVFLIGLIVVINHNFWTFNWQILITLIGWLTLLKGGLQMFVSEKSKIIAEIIMKQNFYFTFLTLLLFVGLFLVYKGFFL